MWLVCQYFDIDLKGSTRLRLCSLQCDCFGCQDLNEIVMQHTSYQLWQDNPIFSIHPSKLLHNFT